MFHFNNPGSLQGSVAELQFATTCHSKGLMCSKPLLDIGYDYIVDNGTKLYRVQVKSVSFLNRKNSASVSCARFDIKNKYEYVTNDFDVLATHVIPKDLWFLVPVEHVRGKRRIRFTFDGLRRTNISKVFENDWQIFER